MFAIAMVLYKAALVASGCQKSYKTKDFDPAFAESRSIMVAMYQIAMLGAIALGIVAMDVNANARAFIQCVASVIGSLGVVLLLMIPKIQRRNQSAEDLMKAAASTQNKSSPGTQLTGSTTTSGGESETEKALGLKISTLQAKLAAAQKKVDDATKKLQAAGLASP